MHLISQMANLLNVAPAYLRAVLAREIEDSELLERFRHVASVMDQTRALLKLISPAQRPSRRNERLVARPGLSSSRAGENAVNPEQEP